MSAAACLRIALGMLQFYRQGISPLMPSSCRYLPSCSEYSIASYKKFGRCSVASQAAHLQQGAGAEAHDARQKQRQRDVLLCYKACCLPAGVWKGSVLTAWRLMRCNPWGELHVRCVCDTLASTVLLLAVWAVPAGFNCCVRPRCVQAGEAMTLHSGRPRAWKPCTLTTKSRRRCLSSLAAHFSST